MPNIYDIVDETCGAGSMEIEGGTNPKKRPKKQISNLSLPKSKSPISGACSNLVNSIVGAGIIGIPYALKESGLLAGFILLIGVTYFTDKTLRILVELAHFHPRLRSVDVLTFEDLLSLPFGSTGSNFILGSMLIVAYGAMVAYLLVIKDTVPIVMGLGDDPGEGDFMERELVMVITALVVIVPLSMQRDMSSLAFTSALSVMADVVLVGIVVIFSPIKESVENAGGLGQVVNDSLIKYGFFIGFGVLTTAMTCQHSAFIVSGSLSNLNSKRWAIVTMISMSTALILSAILGIAGYLGFLEETQGDVLNNFDSDTLEATVARSLLAITMVFTYPMEAFVARHVIMKLLYDGDMDGDDEEESSSLLKSCCSRRILWTWLLFFATLVPALIIDDLGPVLSITGALGGCCLAYIAPGLAYLGMHGDDFLEYARTLLAGNNNESLQERMGATDQYTNMESTSSDDNVWDETSKPWWWYPLLMPVWIRVATLGSKGMNERLDALEKQYGSLGSSSDDASATTQTEVIYPTKGDYFLSMFFVVFGAIACVAGLVSNFVVQVI